MLIYKRVIYVIFSARFGTAIHTLLIIHEFSKEQKVTSDFIAERVGSSPVLIRNLLGQLKKAGFVSVAPRKEKGGTTIAQPLEKISLLSVFDAVDNDKEVTEAHNKIDVRSQTGFYLNEIISDHMITAVNAARGKLEGVTLADVLSSLVDKESASPYENPRALLHDTLNDKIKNGE